MKLNHYTYMEPKTLVLFVLVRETETQTVTRDYHVGLSSARFLSFPFFLLISSGTFMPLLLVLSQGYPWDECRVHFTNESYPQQISLSNFLGVQGSIR